ncbi:stage II sporulation protein M [Persicirhabdus sediminis]|uniref:Stage II sporulation protein M n=1 Tax=Persicirhabdus sediminis TaxID=454144 RepID=A0A8J7MAH7_9BACT|nr:stage II sporulation protein M [Persicirhabdus sediminis]MBK1789552.1 stage II sporulation protein M [Persicirhabdus sediminis]
MQGREFEMKNASRWAEYELLLNELEAGGRRSKSAAAAKLPKLFRELCSDLAIARYRMYDLALCERLNGLVIRGHKLLYLRPAGAWIKVLQFFVIDFPTIVRSEWRLLIIATLAFLLPGIAILVPALLGNDLSWVQAVLGVEGMRSMDSMYGSADDQIANLREQHGSNFMMFCFYIFNNVGIDFRLYAGGLLAGLGSLFFIVYNGLFFGAAVAYIHLACDKTAFYSFVAGHSAPELVAMVIAGMGGLRLGLGFLNPGRKTRIRSLVESAKASLPLIYGAAAMTFFAAIIEGFWSAQPVEPEIKYAVGVFMWSVTLMYFLVMGRRFHAAR